MQGKYHMKASERSRLFRWMGIIILCLMLFGCLYVFTKKGNQENQGTRADRVEQILSEMTLRDKAEQMMVVSFREWKESHTAQDVITVDNKEADEKGDNVTELNDIFRETLRTHHFGGAYLFSENYDCAEQTLKLVADFQKTTVEGGGIPLFIITDQEGGNVTRLRSRDGFPPTLTAEASARGGDDSVSRNARTIATSLSKAGINLNFAPCVDVNVNPQCPVIGKLGRSFSSNPDKVTHFASIWIKEHNKQGIISCLKHFPGHGSASGDTHAGLVDVSKSWKPSELQPYSSLIEQGLVDMVMVAHVINSQLGDDLPASLSPSVVKELLRNQMGFTGVVVTDDLAMGAIVKQYGFEEAIHLAILAGCDLLCLSNNGTRYDPDMVPHAVEAILSMVENGLISAQDIHASAERIRALKKKINLDPSR